jgi:hypothetical protein
MKFPVTLKDTWHKHGGQVTRITKIEHVLDKPKDGRSRDYWHFRGDVKWNDSPPSIDIEIPPYVICYTDETKRQEVFDLIAAMADYLNEHGEWHHDGESKYEGWFAHRSKA